MDIGKDYLNKFEVCKRTIYEFQEICAELEPIYGKGVWSVPCRIGVTNRKIREAHKICEKKGIRKVGYLVGIIKRMK